MNALQVAPQTRTVRKPSPARATKPSAKQQARAHRHRWSHRGVYVFVGTSAILNALAMGVHASEHHASWKLSWGLGGAVAGLIIPCMVFILAKVAGMQWRDNKRTLAYITAGVGLSLLALSVCHCASSLAWLNGSTDDWSLAWVGAFAMAVTIDGGLVACELDIVLG